jgi:hypothetical protein
LHKHLSKKLLNWKRHASTIQTEFRAARTLPVLRRMIETMPAVRVDLVWRYRPWTVGVNLE